MNTKLQALFFDFDGVIVDSTRTKTEAFRTLFQGYSASIIDQVIEHHVQHGGISRIDKIAYVHEHILGKTLDPQELDEWAERYSNLVVEKVIGASWIAGAKEFFEKGFAENVKVFVISGTPETELQHILDARGISHYFHERLGSPVKKPVHNRALLLKYDLDPEYCVFIGDALTDYSAAKETGLHFIGIKGEVKLPDDALAINNCTKLEWAIDQVLGGSPG